MFDDSADRSKPVIVLLHGFLGSLSDWEDITILLREDFRILLVDLPGHGGNPVCGDHDAFTIDSCTRSLVELLDSLDIKKAHLVGYSMGGRLALYFLLTCPENCDCIILESSSPGLRTEVEQAQRRLHDEQLAQKLERDGIEAFVREWYKQPLFRTMKAHPEQFEKLLNRRLRSDPTRLAMSLRMMGTGAQPSLWNRLAEIKTPLLLLAGKKDQKFSAVAAEMADLCPTARVRIIEACGHNVHFERTERFAREVMNFLHRER